MAAIQLWRRTRVTGRRILSRKEPAARIARGVAAGFFAVACPVPGVHVGVGLIAAWIVRGNKLAATLLAAVLPLFLWNPATMLPLAYAQWEIGVRLWPAHASGHHHRLAALLNGWTWSAPWASLKGLIALMGGAGPGFVGPLALGFLVTGLMAAAVSYPLSVVAVWTWRARRRSVRLIRSRKREAAPPLELPGRDAPAPTPAEALARYAREPQEFECAERVRLLVDGGEAYPEMLAAIEGARRTVDLETYMIRADRAGARFRDALAGAAGRGVHVRLLYDYIGSLGLPDRFVRPLIQAGVAVAVYHPVVITRPSWAVNRRDHRKNLVVDGQVAFTGGLNIADEYNTPLALGGWRDTHLRIEGAAPAGRIEELFEYGWQLAAPYGEPGPAARQLASGMQRRLSRPLGPGARRRGLEVSDAPWTRGVVAVRIIGNREFRRRQDIRRAYLHAIQNARRYILIENAYFIPDRRVRRALARAAARRVLVAVVLSRSSDVTVAAYASRSLYSELLASGVRLFEWPLGMMHAKTAVIDDAWATVGSYNFDHRSLRHQLESVAVVADPVFARRLRDQMFADLAQCREITLVEHESRPWRQMLLESAAYLVRRWL
jgi:cardiolipin synthase